jgi:membrane protein
MMAAVRGGLEAALEVYQARPAVRAKLVDFVLIVGAAALVLVTASLALLGDAIRSATGSLGEAVGLGASTVSEILLRVGWVALSIVTVLLLYRFVPSRGLRGRDSLAGAIVTALLFQLISLGSGFVYDKSTRLSVVYGSLTAALVFLYSVYLYSSALLFGAEFAAAWARPPTGIPGPPFWTRLKQAALGLVVRQDADRPATPDDERRRRAGGD